MKHESSDSRPHTLSSAINSLELSVSSINPICQQDTEWTLEDCTESGTDIHLDDFGAIVFTDFSETKADGTTDNLSSAQL